MQGSRLTTTHHSYGWTQPSAAGMQHCGSGRCGATALPQGEAILDALHRRLSFWPMKAFTLGWLNDVAVTVIRSNNIDDDGVHVVLAAQRVHSPPSDSDLIDCKNPTVMQLPCPTISVTDNHYTLCQKPMYASLRFGCVPCRRSPHIRPIRRDLLPRYRPASQQPQAAGSPACSLRNPVQRLQWRISFQ